MSKPPTDGRCALAPALGHAPRLGVVLVAAISLAACDATAPPSATVPEPTAALRPSPARGAVPESAKIASYEIDARLDGETHTITAQATLTWTNRTDRSTRQLPFHLYMNGFRGEDTAWMRSSGGRHRGNRVRGEDGESVAWGYVDVTSMAQVPPPGGGTEPTPLTFREDADPSLLLVDLPAPLGPGETIVLTYEFTTRLPQVFARTGYIDDFHMVGQWFPKIAVLEDAAGWKAHVFTVNDEFYADFGDYRVTLDVPEDMVVGASGIRTGEEIAGGRKKVTYRAEMVHDFAWTAWPDYVEHLGEYQGIRIRQLMPREELPTAPDHLEAQRLSLASFEDRFGPYPWSTITIVHPPPNAMGAGGMEYPTLYTTGPRAQIPPWVRARLLDERMSGVFTTVHEFGHQYFQGLFASNEHEQPWVDEGLNTMADMLAYADAYGEHGWVLRLLGHEISIPDMVRLSLGRAAPLDPIDLPASGFDDKVGSYGVSVYSKTSAAMLTLRNIVGDDDFRAAFAAYAKLARFAHPTGDDLHRTLVATLGKRRVLAGEGAGAVIFDVDDYLDQIRHDATLADFRVQRLEVRRLQGEAGWHRGEDGALVETPLPKEKAAAKASELPDEEVESIVVVAREGGLRVPVEILLTFADGARERLVWDGQGRHHVLRVPGRRVEEVVLDPDHKLLLELDRLDNTRRRGPGPHPTAPPVAFMGNLSEGLTLGLLEVMGP